MNHLIQYNHKQALLKKKINHHFQDQITKIQIIKMIKYQKYKQNIWAFLLIQISIVKKI